MSTSAGNWARARFNECRLLLSREVGGSTANPDACWNDDDRQWIDPGGDCVTR